MTVPSNPEAFRAAIDQAEAAMRDMVPTVATMWKTLIENGLTESAATTITATWLAALVQLGRPYE